MQNTPMTKSGHAALQEELDHLKFKERPRITQAIADAVALGDLSENAEYHSAKEQQGLTEARINYIESRLNTAQVIDITTIAPQGKVLFGVTVSIEDVDTGGEHVYQIVGEDEANINAGKLAVTAPLGRALIGKAVGDVAEVEAPKGTMSYEIRKIEHL